MDDHEPAGLFNFTLKVVVKFKYSKTKDTLIAPRQVTVSSP